MPHKTIEVSDRVLRCCSPMSSRSLSAREADDLAQVFSALGDPARLRMLSIIASDDEVCSCALEEPLAKSQPTISHHTRILVGGRPHRRRASGALDVVACRPRAHAPHR